MIKALQLVNMLKGIHDTEYVNHKYLLELSINLAKEAHEELTPEQRALGMAAGIYDRLGDDIQRMKEGLEPRCVDDSMNFVLEVLDDVRGVFEDEPAEEDSEGEV